jgi:hypothetical protein
MGGKTGLTEMNGDRRRGNAPRKVDAKEPIDDTHEVNFAAFQEETTEESFCSRIFGEVNEVLDVQTQG